MALLLWASDAPGDTCPQEIRDGKTNVPSWIPEADALQGTLCCCRRIIISSIEQLKSTNIMFKFILAIILVFQALFIFGFNGVTERSRVNALGMFKFGGNKSPAQPSPKASPLA